MTPAHRAELKSLTEELTALGSKGNIPGLKSEGAIDSFARQCIDSCRRVEYVHVQTRRALSSERCNPDSSLFDPFLAAILKFRDGDTEEAVWLVFLGTHFGKHLKRGWITTSTIYAGGDANNPWTFDRIKDAIDEFRAWLTDAEGTIPRFVGNHRKYISLSGLKENATGDTVESYLRWVAKYGSQANALQWHLDEAEGDEQVAFGLLYDSIDEIAGFGRTARFDFLCMLQKIGIAKISPNKAYLDGATGPRRGAALMFRGNAEATKGAAELDNLLCDLGAALGFSPNIMEDAVCNWQKSTDSYVPFRG